MNEKTDKSKSLPVVEWLVVGFSSVLTLGLFGYLGWQAVSGDDQEAPMITVETGNVSAFSDGWVVEVEARNHSSQTAAGVEIEGTLRSSGGEVKSSVTLTYVPGNSSRRAGLFFQENPASGDLQVRALGYEAP